MELNQEKCQYEWGEMGGRVRLVLSQVQKGQGSGLLAAPVALDRPPEELLHMPRHVHGVVQVEISVRIQHGVTSATGHREESDHPAAHYPT